MKEENNEQQIHICENPGCEKVAIKKYKSGWCCSTHCALSLASKHNLHRGNNAKGNHKCNKCDLVFNTKRELYQHKVDVHYGSEIYVCVCGKEFHSKRSLGTHKQRCLVYLKSIGKDIPEEFKCECGQTFKFLTSLQSHWSHCDIHVVQEHGLHTSRYWNEKTQMYICECGKEFDNYQSLNAHFCWCMIHKHECGLEEKVAESKIRHGNDCNFSKAYLGELKFNEMRQKAGKTLSLRIQSGELKPVWEGKHHSDKTKQKLRKYAVQHFTEILDVYPRYNKSSIQILEAIAKEHGWNIQHAENGGEFYTGIGYYVDAYDKEKNIVLEYDEKKHYKDVENNILTEKDLERQRNIIEHLHCEFWRYNETTKVLWKVE